MSHSVEVRLPMQSPELQSLMIATPAKWRFYHLQKSKYILRQLVAKHIGPKVAFRQKYGFATPAWEVPENAKNLNFEEVIRNSPIFQDLPFKAKAKSFLLRPEEGRHRWMAYCLALVYDRLHKKQFTV